MKKHNLKELDFVYVCGDAYVDHPSFGHAIISRVLVSRGYTVGIIPQPDWKDDSSIDVFGRPRLGFLVSAGNMDSMVNHYTVAKKHRKTDAYSPGGRMGLRPDNATVVYSNLIRRTYKDVPIILGGIEASLRRLAHYDYWSDKLKRSVLLDSGADILTYGMGERAIVEVADALASGIDVKDLSYIRGTVVKLREDEANLSDGIVLPAYPDLINDKRKYAESFMVQYKNTDPFSARSLYEKYDNKILIKQNPPSLPLSEIDMDDVYELPYMRTYHPMYEKDGGVPAIAEIKFSVTSNRGCFGGCSFCSLNFHQGRIVQTRSERSILEEVKKMTQDRDFKGYVHDVGGPTANFYHAACKKQLKSGACINRQCLYPAICKNMDTSHKRYCNLLADIEKIKGVKKVFIRSGIRYDYLMQDKSDEFLDRLCRHHISGQLRVAPEHISDSVLSAMGKPSRAVYDAFLKKFDEVNKRTGKEQYVVPYLMSSHPGSTLKDAIELACYIKKMGFSPRQVQDFYPTPSTLSTVMYYTGVDPRDMKNIYVPKSFKEKAAQRALIQFADPANYDLVREALLKEGRNDLIGFDKNCLIRPRKNSSEKLNKKSTNEKVDRKPNKKIRNVHRKKKQR